MPRRLPTTPLAVHPSFTRHLGRNIERSRNLIWNQRLCKMRKLPCPIPSGPQIAPSRYGRDPRPELPQEAAWSLRHFGEVSNPRRTSLFL